MRGKVRHYNNLKNRQGPILLKMVAEPGPYSKYDGNFLLNFDKHHNLISKTPI